MGASRGPRGVQGRSSGVLGASSGVLGGPPGFARGSKGGPAGSCGGPEGAHRLISRDLEGLGGSLDVLFLYFYTVIIAFLIDYKTRAETNKAQQNQNILKYIDIQRYYNFAFRSHR